jgi:hypothetical protein
MDNKELQRKERRKYVRSAAKKTQPAVIKENRKYIRLDFSQTFQFTICNRLVEKGTGESVNLSQSGIQFRSRVAPKIGTLIELSVDKEALKELLKIEKLLIEREGELLAEVVRVVKEASGDSYEIAAAFLKKGW